MAYRGRINSTFQALFLLIIFLALAGMFGMIWWIKNVPPAVPAELGQIYQPAPTPGSDLTAIENDGQIKIPAGARNIYAEISGAGAPQSWVRLDLPAASLPEFLANTRCRQPLAPADPKAYRPGTPAPGSIPAWWQPYNAARLEACSTTVEYVHQQVLVDAAKGDTVTVYIYTATGKSSTPTSRP